MSEQYTSNSSENLEKPEALKPKIQKKKIREAYVKLAEALKP